MFCALWKPVRCLRWKCNYTFIRLLIKTRNRSKKHFAKIFRASTSAGFVAYDFNKIFYASFSRFDVYSRLAIKRFRFNNRKTF